MSLEVGGLGFAAHPWPGMIPSPDSGPALEAVVSASLESAFDPAALSGMLMAGASFGVGRLFFSRLAGSQIKNPYLIRSLGSLGGFALEVPAFVASTKTLGMVLGRPADFRPSTLKEEMAGAALVLGSLKLTGWGTFQSLRRFYGPKPAPALTQGVAIQSGMLGGIMGGHYLEGNYHGQEFPGGAEFFSQSLATLFQFNIAGSMLPHLAPGLHRLQQKFSQHETTRRVLSAWAPPRTLPWGPPTPTATHLVVPHWFESLNGLRLAPALMVGEPRYKKPKYIAEKRLRSFPTVEAMPELNNLADLRPDQRWPIFQVALLNLSHSRGKNIQPLQQGLFRAYAQIRERQKSALAGSSDENILPKAVSPVEFQRLLTELRIFFSEQGKVTGRFHWDFLTAEGLVHFLGLSDLLTLNRWMRAWFTVTEKGRTTVSHRASATWVRRVFDHTQSRLELTARLTNYRSEARQLAVSFLEENFWEVPLSQRRRVYGIFRSIVKRSDDPALSARAFEAMRDAYPYLHHLDRYWALKNLAEDWVLYYRNPNFRSVPVSWGSLSHRLGPRELEKLVRFFGNHLGDPAPRIKENAQLALKDMIKYSQKHGKPS